MKFNKILQEKNHLFNYEWYKKYLDEERNLIKNPYQGINSRNNDDKDQTHEVNNNEIKLSKEELYEIDKQLNSQQQKNNSFIILTDHNKGLEEYIIKEIEKLHQELQQTKSV